MKSAYAVLERAAIVLIVAMGTPSVFGQSAPGARDADAIPQARRQEKIQQVESDKTGYAAAIVARWEGAARDSGRWDRNYPADLLRSLTRLDTENLLAAGEASTYEAVLTVLATGRTEPGPDALGQNFQDLVYTPVKPCRIVDTRNALAGALAGNTIRLFEVDAGDLSDQGGSVVGCGIPLAVAQAVEVTIVAVQPASDGFLTAFGLGEQPRTSVLNYSANQVIADTAIIPVVPGGGPDFSVFSLATTHVVVDVLGFFAASSATRLDCTTAQSDVVAVPINELTVVDAFCPAGRASTGGGYDIAEATIAFPGLFITTSPLANGWRAVVENHTGARRNIVTFARCCRVPGR
jgi:hypothetical protein